MARTDLISDVLTSIRNANRAGKEKLDVPASKICEAIMSILKREGYIQDYKYIKDRKQGLLRVYLKLEGKKLTNLARVSKPSLRVYVRGNKIPRVRGGKGIAIISTSKGILSDSQAREVIIGGEVLCYVW